MEKMKHEPPIVFMDTRDNFHPYECDPSVCIHCKGIKSNTHNPDSCALCNFNN